MKTTVYSWRVSPALKSELEDAARAEGISVAAQLERITRAWLEERNVETADDEAEQARIRAAAAPYIGRLRGNDPERAKKAGERVREVIRHKYGR